MADDPNILLGRLAVHYKVIPKDKAQEALRLWKATAAGSDFGAFLVSESYIAPATLEKLVQARDKYQQKLDPAAAAEPVASEPPPPAAPPAPAPSARPAIGAATVRLSAADIAAAAAAFPASDDETDFPAPASDDEFPLPDDASPVAAAPALAAQATVAIDPSLFAPEPESPAKPAPAPPAPEPPVAAPEPQVVATTGAGERLRFGPDVDLRDLLTQTRELGASDLHVHSGAPLRLRIHGRLLDATSASVPPEEAERLIRGLLDDAQFATLEEQFQVDFSYSLPGVGRFRANAYRQQRGLDGVFRAIPPEPPTLAELGLPEELAKYTEFHQGMVLFTGPAGCGKSSTMAAMVRLVNERRPDHILTIEDPIEYVHTSQRCVVNQREVGPHTGSFARALRAALREDPDVIVIGELRDLETISLALTAAETGHLVMGTLHTSSAIRTLNRLLGVFPPEQQAQIRTMVSESLKVIISQRLARRADGSGRSAAIEVLVNNKAVGNLIRDNRSFQIKSIMQTGTGLGMCLLDASLADLVKRGVITKQEAAMHAEDTKKFL